MIIDCIADLHGFFPELEGGDLLIIAGDLTAGHQDKEYIEFNSWLLKQKYRKKVLVSGNHDVWIEEASMMSGTFYDCEYLYNSGTEFEGLKIWGTPHSLIFDGVNPRCTAFMETERGLKKKYELIPEGIDILISHSPPCGVLDVNSLGECCGSLALRETMFRVKPKYLICGHIHECGGKTIDLTTTHVINCSHVDENYKPKNKPIRITIGDRMVEKHQKSEKNSKFEHSQNNV
jgi:Icc-related predicted phosphoesterase